MKYKFRIREKVNALDKSHFTIEIGEKIFFWYSWKNIWYTYNNLLPKTNFCFFTKEDAEYNLNRYKDAIEKLELERTIIKDVKYNY